MTRAVYPRFYPLSSPCPAPPNSLILLAGRRDLNTRPSVPKADALPGCATPARRNLRQPPARALEVSQIVGRPVVRRGGRYRTHQVRTFFARHHPFPRARAAQPTRCAIPTAKSRFRKIGYEDWTGCRGTECDRPPAARAGDGGAPEHLRVLAQHGIAARSAMVKNGRRRRDPRAWSTSPPIPARQEAASRPGQLEEA